MTIEQLKEVIQLISKKYPIKKVDLFGSRADGTNQSDSEKMTELQTSNETLIKENNYLKVSIKVAESDVKKEFQKFVTSEVINAINETTDSDTALKNFKKENPQYFGETVVKKVQTSPSLNVGGNQPQTTNNIMNELLRGARK